MNTDEQHKIEKRHAIEKTFHDLARFFYDKSIGSGRLKKELTRLSVWHIRYASNIKSHLCIDGCLSVIEHLCLTKQTITHLDPTAKIIDLINETIAMIEETRNKSRNRFSGDFL